MLSNRIIKYLVISLLVLVGCISHLEIVHWGTSNNSQTEIDKAGVVNLTPTDVNKGGAKMDLAYFGKYGEIISLSGWCLLAIAICGLLLWLGTQYFKTKVPWAGIIVSIVVSLLIVGVRSLLTAFHIWRVPYGEIQLDLLGALLLTHFLHNLIARVGKRKKAV